MRQNPTKLDLLLAALADGQWHSSDELVASVGHRFSVSVQGARAKGYCIEHRRDGNYHEWRMNVTEKPATYNPGYSDEEFAKRRNRAKIIDAIAKLERQGVPLSEVLEVLADVETQTLTNVRG